MSSERRPTLRPFTVIYMLPGRGRATQTWTYQLMAEDADSAMFDWMNKPESPGFRDVAWFVCAIIDGPVNLVFKTGGSYDAALAKRLAR